MHVRFGDPLLAARARPWIGAVLVGCAILVTGLGLLFAHDARADRFDHAIDAPIIALFASHQNLAFRLSTPGALVPAVLVTAVIVVTCLLTGRLKAALLAAAAVPVADGLAEGLIKPMVDRTYGGQLTYPSGHTTAVFALAATVTVLLLVPPLPVSRRTVRLIVAAAAGAIGGIVAIAVIGLKWHYFTDTVAGAAVGIGAVCGLALVLDLPTVSRWLSSMESARPGSIGRSTSKPMADDQGTERPTTSLLLVLPACRAYLLVSRVFSAL